MVRLLKRVASKIWRWNLSRKDDNRRRVHLSRRDPSNGVCRGGTGCNKDNTGSSGSPRITVCHVCCPLLVPCKNVFYNVCILGHNVIYLQYIAPRKPKYYIYSLVD